MILAARAFTELYGLVKLEDELHREVFAFSISHDHRSEGISMAAMPL